MVHMTSMSTSGGPPMTTSTEGCSTAETRTMALAMFADAIPCFFQLMDPSCEQTAHWITHFVHEENTSSCDAIEPVLVCDEHKGALQRSTSPFWRVWFSLPAMPCGNCGTPMRIDRFEAI